MKLLFVFCTKKCRSVNGGSRCQEPVVAPPRGEEYLVYLSDGDVPFLWVSFSPIFSSTGYHNRAIFLEQVVKACIKGIFC